MKSLECALCCLGQLKTDLHGGVCRERGNNGTITPNKMLVKVCKTQEALYLPSVARLGLICDSLDLLWIHLEQPLPENKPKEGY